MTQITIQEVLQKTDQNEKFIVREHLVFQALTKISRYRAECAIFEQKYGNNLDVILKNRPPQTEDFDLEDDLLDWEYANTALQWWKNCIQEFQYAA